MLPKEIVMRKVEYAAILGWKAREVPEQVFATEKEAERHLKELRRRDPSGWYKSYRVHSRIVNGAAKGRWEIERK
jgi:hypothetical protein